MKKILIWFPKLAKFSIFFRFSKIIFLRDNQSPTNAICYSGVTKIDFSPIKYSLIGLRIYKLKLCILHGVSLIPGQRFLKKKLENRSLDRTWIGLK